MKDFKTAWDEKIAEGYQYGDDALEQVRFGWELRQAEVDRLQARVAELEATLKDSQHWRERHCRDAEAFGAQSQANWERARKAEALVAELEAELKEVKVRPSDVCRCQEYMTCNVCLSK